MGIVSPMVGCDNYADFTVFQGLEDGADACISVLDGAQVGFRHPSVGVACGVRMTQVDEGEVNRLTTEQLGCQLHEFRISASLWDLVVVKEQGDV